VNKPVWNMTSREIVDHAATKRGWNDHKRGVPITANPYGTDDVQRNNLWRIGWNDRELGMKPQLCVA